jgi:hemolysin activation/secretion protein
MSLISSGAAFAQVDAGALQQNLEKQLPLPSPLALPESSARDGARPGEARKDELTFQVKQFVLEGISILPEASIQEVLKPWVGRAVSFDDLQKACDAVVDFYRKSGYTVQAILPHKKSLTVL